MILTIPAASDPLTRTTPIPPRPGGVATATIVSEEEYIARATPLREEKGAGSSFRSARRFVPRDNNDLHESVTDALGCCVGILGDGQVNDATGVRIERTDLLRLACFAGARGEELCRFLKLGVLSLPVVEAIYHDVPTRMIPPKGGIDEVLHGVERRRLTPYKHITAIARDHDPGSVGDRFN